MVLLYCQDGKCSWKAAAGFVLCAAAVCAAAWATEPERLARRGQYCLRHKRYRRAEALFSLMIRRAPYDRRGYEGSAEALVRLGRADLAFEVLTKGTERIS